ncbi:MULTISPECIES: TrbI/VirB10 family protein [unclassified Inquilinus]|uniref:TrbI/VirB10 family protein n=1 Tax=unclassified Inquilinus TaxID=2645927 RepID=UPI003F8F5478
MRQAVARNLRRIRGERSLTQEELGFRAEVNRSYISAQGAKLIGRYDSAIAQGQSRVLLVWQRIVMPNGRSIVLDNVPAADAAGYGGLEDEVDVHGWQLLQAVVLSTLLGVGTELTFGEDESDLVRALRQSTQQGVNQVGQRMTERALDIQPTLKVRPGWPLRVVVNKDLVLEPYQG